MTRSELIRRLAERFPQFNHIDAEMAVKTILDSLSDALGRHDRIEIRGFGSFSINIRPARKGRNPKTGNKVDVPKKAAPHFKPGNELRERVNSPPKKPKGHLAA